MHYAPEDWNRLQYAAEAIGGAISPDLCSGASLTYRIETPGGRRFIHERTTFCKNKCKVVLPYRLPKEAAEKRHTEDGLVLVCAVDDAVGMWPRFAGVIDPEKSGLSGPGVDDLL